MGLWQYEDAKGMVDRAGEHSTIPDWATDLTSKVVKERQRRRLAERAARSAAAAEDHGQQH